MPRVLALLPLCAIACNEYDLEQQDGPNDGGNAPVAVVEPEAILGAVCGEDTADAQVTVRNEGTALLAITDAAITGDWTVEALVLPLTIPVDASAVIRLSGTGAGLLTLDTSDPERPQLEIPVDAVAGAPPEVAITAPLAAEVVAVGVDVELTATVNDVDGDPTDLALVWSSDIDGVIGTSTINASGTATFTWPGVGRSPGPHTLTATVDHPCGDGVATVEICQQGGYLEEELDIANWHFEGSASWDAANDWLQVTSTAQYSVGSAFETGQTVRGDDVVVRFRMYVGDGTGADGMSVTVLDADRMTTFLGGDGCGLGFGGGGCSTSPVGLPGYTVEFDTYYNSEVDPTEDDHVTFYVDGDLTNPIAWAATPGLEDSGWHDVEVRVQAPAIEVSIDGQVVISEFVTGQVDFDFPAHVGFTAGTGYFTNHHLVDALEVEQLVCE